MSGSEQVPPAEHAAEQMREATERLREQAWMVAPMTSAVIDLTEADEAAAKA